MVNYDIIAESYGIKVLEEHKFVKRAISQGWGDEALDCVWNGTSMAMYGIQNYHDKAIYVGESYSRYAFFHELGHLTGEENIKKRLSPEELLLEEIRAWELAYSYCYIYDDDFNEAEFFDDIVECLGSYGWGKINLEV